MQQLKYLAFDLGAESGRVVLGRFDGHKLSLEDVHRFPTGASTVLGTMYWDALRLFADCKRGLAMAAAAHSDDIDGMGIDTWGVDFGLLDASGRLLSNPRHYRDHGNDGMVERAIQLVGRDRLFNATGIQILQINSLYQLLALKQQNSPTLTAARRLLFMPDLLKYWFSGVISSEYTISSTSQMLNPTTRNWALDLLAELELPHSILSDIVMPGTQVGYVGNDIQADTGCRAIPVLAVGEHDTASAVAAVPAVGNDWAYLSCGTWSLMGIESSSPILTPEMARANLTNEGGVCGTIRVLKNIMGLWLVQECRRSFARKGYDYSYSQLTTMAEQSKPFGPLVDPDAAVFLSPADMAEAITEFCTNTDQTPPASPGEFVRCCLESLALKFRWTMDRLQDFHGQPLRVLHIVGGGTQNRLLCQLAADATQREVIAGPVEATAAGNVLLQAIARGTIGSLAEGREIVRRSFEIDRYEPGPSSDGWQQAWQRFVAIRASAGMED